MSTLLTKEFLVNQINHWDTAEILQWMAQYGSSVSLDWDEERRAWVCSWVTGDTRFNGCDVVVAVATVRAAYKGINGNYERWAEEHIPD